ncbi:MAG TPA: hypothetical protein VIZ20_19000 [Streptosporangiaceae bacterium]
MRVSQIEQPDREEPIVGQKTVRFSDLSGQLITEEDTLTRVVVLEHPELGDSPVEFEALLDETQTIEKSALAVAVLELHLPGEDEPRRVTVDLEAFDAMATDTAMSELLITARPARKSSRTASATSSRGSRASTGSGTSKVNYATLEHAGEPHKGKITDTEKQLVQEHLDEINDRLVSQGLRTISLADPEHVERYGLAREQLGEQDPLPIKELTSERDEDFAADEDEVLAS